MKTNIKILLVLMMVIFVTPTSLWANQSLFEKQNQKLAEDLELGVGAIVDPAIEAGRLVGVVVGIVTPDGYAVFSYGATKPGGKDQPDFNTLYALGTTEKLFNNLLLTHFNSSQKKESETQSDDLFFDNPKSYQKYFDQSIGQHLGLSSSGVILAGNLKKKMTAGYSSDFVKTKPLRFDAQKNTVALYSSASDLLKLLAGHLGLIDAPVRKNLDAVLHAKKTKSAQDNRIGYWSSQNKSGNILISHNGSGEGFGNWLGIIKNKKTGIVVLANTETHKNWLINDIGLEIFNYLVSHNYRPLDLPMEKSIKVPIKDYQGEYRTPADKITAVKAKGGKLVFSLNDKVETVLYPMAENKFFSKKLNLTLHFKRDSVGEISKYISVMQGREDIARKIK